MAPTLYQVEEQYRDQVNFVMVNGDDPDNWPIIEALGVDAIPHLAFVESDGTVDTALIGPVPVDWLHQNIDTLLENASTSHCITQEQEVGGSTGDESTTTSSSSSSSSTITAACAGIDGTTGQAGQRKPLPYQMLDVFANRPPEERRIRIGGTADAVSPGAE
jgi:thioredoxin-like negative regulator of GroEL